MPGPVYKRWVFINLDTFTKAKLQEGLDLIAIAENLG